MILMGNNESYYIDEKNNILYNGKKKYQITKNIILRQGDLIRMFGQEFLVVKETPYNIKDTMKRGAQIIQPETASLMVALSGIKYGSRVLESGTGSGLLTSFILNAIEITENYTGVEINIQNIVITQDNVFRATGKTPKILNENFFELENFKTKYDAIFLDLPEPWKNIEFLRSNTVNGGSIITYLPTFDQVEKTVSEMTDYGFKHMESFWISKTGLIVRQGSTRPENFNLTYSGTVSHFIKSVNTSVDIE
ncbi:hypothetical protein [Caldiplasma sukawensis]